MGGDPRMENTRGVFHHQVAQWITVQIPRQQAYGVFATLLCQMR